ncbi:hypothetical protein DFH08DRAFT_826796 [Mycena albidolilacea]|uniref:Uncharacterized protein n=1 Tax=Mycena albidolilacea TaxID=1033008 RepID=A0AAD6YZH9_9AGAR|nr:hypothetical protein DFH08DRAFT_826796 [Mycena albidolilacea]
MWVRIGTSLTFPQYPSPNSQRARRKSELHRQGCDLKCRGSVGFAVSARRRRWVPVEAWGAHHLRVVHAMPACGTVTAANAAGTGDEKPPGGVINGRGGIGLRMDGGSGEGMGQWGDSCSVCCAQEMVPVLFAGCGRARFRVVAGVGAEGAGHGSGGQGGDNRSTGDGERLLWVLRMQGVVHASALRACGSRRVVFAGDAIGARGGDKSGAGDGERLLHALRTQEAMKMQASVGGGGALLGGHGVQEGDEASLAARHASVTGCMVPRAASDAAGRGARIRLTRVPKLTIAALRFTCVGDGVREVLVEGRVRVVYIGMMVMRKKRRAGHTACSGAKNGLPILKTIGHGLTQTRHYTRKG